MTPDIFQGWPLHFVQGSPVLQAMTLGFATFFQEDVPTVTAAVLASTGALSGWVGLLGCFLGIWFGDALLYLGARTFGRPLLRYSWASRFASPDSIARSERWFAEKGAWLLVSSRFVPGTRLPTYLAAGFLRVPFTRFLQVTGVVVAVWTVGIFAVAQVVGPQLGDWLRRWNGGGWVLVGVIVLGSLALRSIPRILHGTAVGRMRAMAGRLVRWEFWPAWLFYLPVGLCYVRLALKHRSLTLPSAANPGILTGGLVGESKFDTLEHLFSSSPEFTAESWLLPPGDAGPRREALERIQGRERLTFPFILAVRGPRGLGLTRAEIIATFARRLDNHPDFEHAEALRNIHRIAEIRLNDKFGVDFGAEPDGPALDHAGTRGPETIISLTAKEFFLKRGSSPTSVVQATVRLRSCLSSNALVSPGVTKDVGWE